MEDGDGAHGDALEQAGWEVYGVAPSDFVASRTRWVKSLRKRGFTDEARAVAALRKPSVSAAAMNALVRADDPVASRLREVGVRMRHAQSALDASGLAGLRGERDQVLRDWVAAAVRHSPVPLTATVEAEVRDTGVAALADGSAAEVALSGTLTRALSYSGFGEVDVQDAVARTSTGVVLTRITGGGGETEDPEAPQSQPPPPPPPGHDVSLPPAPAREAALLAQLRASVAEAEDEVSAARAARRVAAETEQAAQSRAAVAEQGLEQARRLLDQAQTHLATAQDEQELARAGLADAEAALTAARDRRDRVRAELEEAEDSG